MAGNFFHGTSVEQDGRWGKIDQKMINALAKEGKLAPILETKVILKKINLDVISKWVTQKVIQDIGFDDDILINTVINMLQAETVDPKRMIISLTAFLDKKAPAFVEQLWTLLVDAQNQPSGIPSQLIEQKKEELSAKNKTSSSNNAVNIIPFDGNSRSAKEPELDDPNRVRRKPSSPTFATRRGHSEARESPERGSFRRDNTPKRRRDQSPSEPRRRNRDDTPMRTRRATTPRRTRAETPSRRPRDREDSPRRRGRDDDSPVTGRKRRSRTPERRRSPSPKALRTDERRHRKDDSPPVRKSNREQTPSRRRPRRESPSRDRERDRSRERDSTRNRDKDRDYDRDRDRDHERKRDRDRDRDRSREKERKRSREDRESDRHRDRSRSKSRDRQSRREQDRKEKESDSNAHPSPKPAEAMDHETDQK